MGGRQKKKTGGAKKKKPAQKPAQKDAGAPFIPSVHSGGLTSRRTGLPSPSSFELADHDDPGWLPSSDRLPSDEGNPPDNAPAPAPAPDGAASFEELAAEMKAADSLSVGQSKKDKKKAAKAAAAAAVADDDWTTADMAYEDLQRACVAHAKLWAQVDKLTPARDDWYARWQECEDACQREIAMETQLQNKDLRGRASTDKSKEYFALGRTLKSSKKRLGQVNDEITRLTREILNLEERYPVNSKRLVDAKMKDAVVSDDPAKLMAALQPDEAVKEDMQRRRCEVSAFALRLPYVLLTFTHFFPYSRSHSRSRRTN